jgi:hypothetical protein
VGDLKALGLGDLKGLGLTQRRTVDKLMKGIGLRRTGHYYIGTFNQDVITGYCLDKPPLNAYVWRFALPAYDSIDFLHLALGERILHFTKGGNVPDETSDPAALLQRDWARFSQVQDCSSLIGYIDRLGFGGPYTPWTRLITHVRCREFDAAERISTDAEIMEDIASLRAIERGFAELTETRRQQGWEGCASLLDKWQQQTREKFLSGRIQM